MFSWFRQRRHTKAAPDLTRPSADAGTDPTAADLVVNEADPRDTSATPVAEYDAALASAGVALVQRSATPGAFHVSAALGALLGHDPSALSRPGGLRWLVHPDDLDIFDARFGAAGTDTHAPVLLRMWARDDWTQVLITGSAPGDPAAIVHAPTEQPHLADRWFCELVERAPSMCLVFGFTDEQTPDTLVLLAANSTGRRALRLRDDHGAVPVSAVLHEDSAQLLRSMAFDVVHTGRAMTLERVTLAEFPGSYLDLRTERLSDGHLAVVLDDVTATVALEDHLRRNAGVAAGQAQPTEVVHDVTVEARRVDPSTGDTGPGATGPGQLGAAAAAELVDLTAQYSDRPVGVDDA